MRYRTVGVFFFVIAGLMILAAINVRIISSAMITPAKIEAALYKISGTKFVVGEIDFNFWRGIKVSDIRIPMTDASGKQTYDFIKAKSIRVTYDQTKLLRGQFLIDKVVIYNPELNLSNNRFPAFQFNSGGGSAAPTIIMKNATLLFSDQKLLKDNAVLRLSDANINLYPITSERYVVEGEFEAGKLGSWKIHGELTSSGNDIQMDLVSKNTDIGNYLAGILSANYNSIWTRYQPRGLVNLNVAMKIANFRPSDIKVTMDCQNNDMIFAGFPYPISKMEGQVDFTLTGATLKNLRGVNGTCVVNASGVVNGYEQAGGLDLLLKIQNMNFDNRLYNTLDAHFKKIWDGLAPSGPADAEVFISKNPGAKQETHYQTKIYCHGMQAKPSFFTYPAEKLTGEIEIFDNLIKLKTLTAQRNKGELKIDGEITLGKDGQPDIIDVNVNAKNIEINDYTLKDAVNKILTGINAFWEKAQPEGPVDANISLHKSAGQPGINAETTIQCKGLNAKVGASSLPLTNIQGQIEHHSNNRAGQAPDVVFKNLIANYDKSRFELSGNISNLDISTNTSKTKPKIAMDIKISNLTLGGKGLYSIFPANLKYLLEQIEFQANSDINLRITNGDGPDSGNGINYQGELKLFDCGFTKGIDFSDITGVITVKGFHSLSENTQTNYLAGSGKLSQLRIENKIIQNMSVQFLQENNHINFYGIKGNAYNGAINGFLIITLPALTGPATPTDTYEYQGKIEIGSLDIKEFARDTQSSNKDLSGKLSGELTFNGKGAAIEALSGTGRAILTDAQIWEVPVFFSVYTLFGLTEKTVFHEGEIRFSISNGEMLIKKLVFTSNDVILKSAGKMNLKDGTLDIQFDTKFLDIKIIKILDDIKNLFAKAIYTVKIVGTFDNPKAEIKPLPILFD